MAIYPAGIGSAPQAQQATAAMRAEPWYQQLVSSWGLNPRGDAKGNVSLSETQQQQLLDAARQHGIGISDHYQIDENGQIAETPGHLVRNIAIGAGIAGLALTGFGAAGIGPLAGAFGAGGAAGSAAAGAAATGAGSAATGAGMAGGAAGWFSSPLLIPSAVQGVASIFGANAQATASREAADLQHQSTEEALADARAQREYAQTQYADYLGRLQPYLSLGTTAGSTLQNLLARSPYTQMANDGEAAPPPYAATPRSIGSGQTPAAATAAPARVMLRAPNGATKQVSSDQVSHYVGLGAVPV